MPSLHIGGALRAAGGRLRPGRWAFRTTAISLVALVVGTPSLRDAMVEEINWSRSVLETIEMPTVQLPALEMPVELPTVVLPAIELPTIQIPAFELPAFQLPRAESAAESKLVPAPFELPPLNAYRAAFETQASYPTVPPSATVEWVVALRNTGSAGWYRGVAGAQAATCIDRRDRGRGADDPVRRARAGRLVRRAVPRAGRARHAPGRALPAHRRARRATRPRAPCAGDGALVAERR